jgi:hypothetical protein
VHILQFFAHSHLPPHLAEVSRPFGELAERLATCLPDNPERDVALRKLLEAKDAAVRAMVAKTNHAAPEPGALPAYTTRDVNRPPWRLFGWL